ERLRKGDELQHFFETFERMVDDLRRRQQGEIAKVDRILERLESAPVSQRGNKEFDADGITMLKDLRTERQDQLDARSLPAGPLRSAARRRRARAPRAARRRRCRTPPTPRRSADVPGRGPSRSAPPRAARQRRGFARASSSRCCRARAR